MFLANPFPHAARAKATVAAAALSLAVTILLLAPALAAAIPEDPDETGASSTTSSTGSQLGHNIANLITDFTKPMLVAVAGMMSFAAFGKRDTGRVLQILGVTLVIGGLVYNPGDVFGKVIETCWKQVS
jgi:hypothetical protein